MDNNFVLRIMKEKKHLLFILIIALFIELVLFNFRFFFSLNNESIKPDVYFSDGTQLEYGVPYPVKEGMILNIYNINQDVENIHLGVADIGLPSDTVSDYDKEVKDVLFTRIYLSDEGNSQIYHVKDSYVSSLYPNSQTISIEPFGKVQNMQVIFGLTPTIAGEKYVVFNDVSLNDEFQYDFNILRLIIIYMILYIIYSFMFGGYKECDYTKVTTIAKTAFVFLLTAASLIALLTLVKTQFSTAALGYQDLARAILDKRLWVAQNTDPVLEGMQNPYSFYDRRLMGATYFWDTAYYNGFYYIYFGVVPAALLFVPYLLVTGQDLTYYRAELFIILVICVCCFILVDMLRKRIAPKTPWKVTMLLSVIMASLSGAILVVKRVQIYYIAIATALMLVLMGLCFWIASANRFKQGKNVSALIIGFIGSGCMALAVGSRPQFAMASFLVFAIYADLFKTFKKSFKYLLILVIPYIIVGALLMWYNYARFGSPFDFGANYNLTGYDMTHMGIHPSRTLIGIWYYLFNLPRLTIEFPYIIGEEVITYYPGYIACEKQIGGALILLPICFIMLVLFSKKKRAELEQTNTTYKNNMTFVIICLISVVIVVILDTVMCGILTRYQMDYRLYILMASIIVSFMMFNKAQAKGESNKMYRIIAALCLLTMLFGIFTITGQYEDNDYSTLEHETSIILRMEELFGLIKY